MSFQGILGLDTLSQEEHLLAKYQDSAVLDGSLEILLK